LEKCRNKNKLLFEEVLILKKQIEILVCEKEKLAETVDKLCKALECCKNDKKQLLAIIAKLREKNKKYEEQNAKLEFLVRKQREEIEKLNNKVKLLICQNKELEKENHDLKKKLAKILDTLKCLCDKYNALKKRCKHRCRY